MVLEIQNLKAHYQSSQGPVKAVDGVSLTVGEGQVFGLAGESGCGKSTLLRTLMRLTPRGARVTADRLAYRGRDLLDIGDREYRREVLWQEISLVPQSAMNSLNPVYRVGDQVVEAIRAHTDLGRAAAAERVGTLFSAVGLQPGLTGNYPHELSGGMRQRVLIAMSLALSPGLILMDEPTTGLDVLVQERILRSIAELRRAMERPAAILLITHDISVIAEMSDRIGIMYAGRMMEQADTLELFREPYHPYTLGLKNAFPSIRAMGRELISIPGSPPSLAGEIPGCVFAPRCPFAIPECDETRPHELEVKPGHTVACIRTDHAEEFRQRAGEKRTWQSSKSAA